MAAQDRARAAQEQQKALEDQLSVHEHKDRIVKALGGKTDWETTEKDLLPPPFEMAEKQAPAAPPTFHSVEEILPPPIATTAAPPPSFEAVENALPPAFDTVEHKLPPSFDPFEPLKASTENSSLEPSILPPSAPPVDLHVEEESHLTLLPILPPPTEEHSLLQEGIENVLPPPSASDAPLPTFEQVEAQLDAQLDEEAFMLDENGKPLSAAERKKMMDEQRIIMTQIQKEATDNAAAIAAVQAENFDQRSSSAAAVVAGTSGPPPTAVRGTPAIEEDNGQEDSDHPDRTVQIGGGQNVALHGQDRTKAAIVAGTAILVECMNCQNWMQVTDTATLMFCPICSVVSPVQKQSEVNTKEEAIQLTRDRQMAERLQAEINSELDGGGARAGAGRSAAASSGATEKSTTSWIMSQFLPESTSESEQQRSSMSQPPAPSAQSTSWWDTVSTYLSVGVSDTGEHHRGNIGVSLPPSNITPSQRQLHGVTMGAVRAKGESSSSSHVERQGLLSAPVDSATQALPTRHLGSARVAESKPLFSCIADSVSSVASTVGQSLTAITLTGDNESNVHGVDSSSLLVTTAGREGGGGASYSQLPDRY